MLNLVSLSSPYLPTVTHSQELHRAASLSALAATALGSVALAYYNPGRWLQTTALITSVQIFTLPSLIRKAKTDWLRSLLIASMLGVSCLLAGGGIVGVFKHSSALCEALRGARLSKALSEFIWVSGLVGYGLPACQAIFNKTQKLAQSPHWNDKLAHLQAHLTLGFENFIDYLNQTVQSGLMLTTLASSHLVQWCLISLCLRLRIDIVPSLLMIEASSTSQGVEHLNEIINKLKALNWTAQLLSIPIADNVKDTVHDQLKQALSQIDDEADLQKAFALLQNDLIPLIPSWQSPEQFIDLFQGRILVVMNAKIEAFVQDIESDTGAKNRLFLDYELFEQGLLAFEQAHANRASQQDLLTLKNQLQPQLNRLKADSEKILMSKQVWQGFFEFFQLVEEAALHRLTNPQHLMRFIEEHALDFQRIRTIHHSLSGEIYQRLQRCINLAAIEEDEDEEAVSACLFLGAERCDFRMRDYEELQRWLNVNSLPEIEDKLNAIGLRIEEDLYLNDILPRREFIDKQSIKNNLKAYIDHHLAIERKWTTRLYKSISQLKQTAPSLNAMVEKIIQFTYTLYLKAFILVPILVHPASAVTGCLLGTTYFALVPFMQSNGVRRRITTFSELFGRLSSQMNITFSNGNWQTRSRLVYWMALATYFLNSPTGSFLQGVSLSRMLVNSFRT